LPEGSVFFALAGPSHDGHDHVAAAASQGAAVQLSCRQDHG
jgi:UDP-N-acetylmuramyl pentapeptide synthase